MSLLFSSLHLYICLSSVAEWNAQSGPMRIRFWYTAAMTKAAVIIIEMQFSVYLQSAICPSFPQSIENQAESLQQIRGLLKATHHYEDVLSLLLPKLSPCPKGVILLSFYYQTERTKPRQQRTVWAQDCKLKCSAAIWQRFVLIFNTWCDAALSFVTKPRIANHVRQLPEWQQFLSVKSISLWKPSPSPPPCISKLVGNKLPFFFLNLAASSHVVSSFLTLLLHSDIA